MRYFVCWILASEVHMYPTMKTMDHGYETGGRFYGVKCLNGCGEYWANPDPDVAWAEANEHERSTGHATKVVSHKTGG